MPTHFEALIARGNQRLEMGTVLRAQQVFQEAYRISQKNRDLLIGLAWCSHKRNDLNGALAYLHQALELNADDTLVLRQIGWCQYFHGHFKDAVNTFRTILRIDGSDIDAASFLGLSLIWVDELEEAQELLNGVLTRDAANVESRVGIAMLEVRNGDNRSAIENLNAVNKAGSAHSPEERQYFLSLMFPAKKVPET